MGYHIRIDESSEHLLRLLSVQPSQVFGKLYSAYLLFLATEHDREQLDWIVSNAPALDSLSGSHLAYAVFAKSFPVRLRSDAVEPKRDVRNIGQLDAKTVAKSEAVTRLVENGVFGVVLDGDELTAITYGTDIVARDLNLLDKLPCLVVLDAIPAAKPRTIRLESALLPTLFQLLRGAVARFYAANGHTTIRRDAEIVLDIQRKIEAELGREARIRNQVATERQKIIKLRSKIAAGIVTKDPNFFQDIVASREDVIVDLEKELDAFPEQHPQRLAELESELRNAMLSHRRHKEMTFSHCIVAELFAQGFKDLVGSAKIQSMGFLSSLFKPDTLLKLWSLVH